MEVLVMMIGIPVMVFLCIAVLCVFTIVRQE
jgi:hypothetical protein